MKYQFIAAILIAFARHSVEEIDVDRVPRPPPRPIYPRLPGEIGIGYICSKEEDCYGADTFCQKSPGKNLGQVHLQSSL